jgi:hypothetical protein
VERNQGLVIMKTSSTTIIKLLSLYRDIYVRHVNDMTIPVNGDQSAFREALFIMRTQVMDRVIPYEIGCRLEYGCDDGCLAVHRPFDQDKSGSDVRFEGFIRRW